MNDEYFSIFNKVQHSGHCGVFSLSGCLLMLGIDKSPEKVRNSANRSYAYVRNNGFSPADINKGAIKVGANCRFIGSSENKKHLFFRDLKKHLLKNGPAIVAVDWYGDRPFNHWVCIIGIIKIKGKLKYLIWDPIDEDNDNVFDWYNKKDLEAAVRNDDADNVRFYAICLKRKDQRAPCQSLINDMTKLCQKGSEESVSEIVNDLREIVTRAGKVILKKDPLVANIFKDNKIMIIESVWQWIQHDKHVSKHDLVELYDAYTIIAELFGIRCPKKGERELIAQFTVILAAYTCYGGLV